MNRSLTDILDNLNCNVVFAHSSIDLLPVLDELINTSGVVVYAPSDVESLAGLIEDRDQSKLLFIVGVTRHWAKATHQGVDVFLWYPTHHFANEHFSEPTRSELHVSIERMDAIRSPKVKKIRFTSQSSVEQLFSACLEAEKRESQPAHSANALPAKC